MYARSDRIIVNRQVLMERENGAFEDVIAGLFCFNFISCIFAVASVVVFWAVLCVLVAVVLIGFAFFDLQLGTLLHQLESSEWPRNVGLVAWLTSAAVTMANAGFVILALLSGSRTNWFLLDPREHDQAVSVAPLAISLWWTIGHLMAFAVLVPAILLLGWDPIILICIEPLSVPVCISLGAKVWRAFWNPAAGRKMGNSNLEGRRHGASKTAAYAVAGIVLIVAGWALVLSELYVVGCGVGMIALISLERAHRVANPTSRWRQYLQFRRRHFRSR